MQAPERGDTAEEFEAILIGGGTESAVRLGELGRVEFGAESYGTESLYSGQPSAQIGVFQAPGANAIEVVGALTDELDRLAERFPPGIEYELAFSTATFVQKSIQNVVVTLLVTVALVVATVYLFLQQFRATLLPCIVIPVALIGSFTVLYLLGFSINTLSLLGMILAVGLVVDDAIVVVENVTRTLHEGDLAPGDAVKSAMAEVTGPILATTLVLLGLFVPVAFIPGLTGSLYNQFALTIAVTVSISSLTALTLTPALARVMLRPREKPPVKPFRRFNRGFEAAAERYRHGIERLERVWWFVLLGFAALLALVVMLFLWRPIGFVPEEDQGYLIVDVQLPPGAALERSSAVVRELEARLLDEPEVEETVAIAGSSLIGDAAASYTGFMILRLAPWGERDAEAAAFVERIQNELRAYPHARVQVINPPSLPGIGAGGGLAFEIQALDTQPIDELAEVSERVIGALNGAPEIAAAFTGFNAEVPQLELEVDEDRAEQLGVPSGVLYGALQSYLGSSFVNEFTRFGRIYRVYVQAEAGARDDPEDIRRLEVRNAQGRMVPLAQMVDVRFATGPEAITHFDLYRSVGVIAQAAPGVSSGQATAAIERVLDDALPGGYGFGWTGAVYQQEQAGDLAPLIFGLAVLFAFLTLAAQYESFVLPGAILLAAPFAMLGALGLLTILDMPIDVFAQIGLLMLVGLSAKNAILIVSFAEDARHEGASPAEAAATAGALRLRPVLMTALSFILGAMPLAFASGAGANAQASVGITVIGGMIAATILTLLVTPVLYMLAARLRGGDGERASEGA